ncbi:MAG: hypothetical protein ACTHMC_07590, partial [Pseudobacter sp.]
MSFLIDKQTLEDLNLMGKYKPNAIFGMFNKVKTAGGERLLESFFRHPLTDAEQINQRAALFSRFGELDLKFPVTGKAVEVMENYLNTATGNRFAAPAAVLGKRMALAIGVNKNYNQLAESVNTTIEVLKHLSSCFMKLKEVGDDIAGEEIQAACQILAAPELEWLKK